MSFPIDVFLHFYNRKYSPMNEFKKRMLDLYDRNEFLIDLLVIAIFIAIMQLLF